MKLRLKITALMFAVLIPTLAVTSAMTIGLFTQQVKGSALENMEDDAVHTMDTISFMLGQRLSDIQLLSKNPVISSKEFSAKEKMEYLWNFERTYKTYASVSIYDTNGIKTLDTRSLALGVDESQEPFFKAAIAGQPYYDKQPTFSESLQDYVIQLSAPLHDGDGDISGVVAAQFPIDKVNYIVKELASSEQDYSVYLAAEDGTIIYYNNEPDIISKQENLSDLGILAKISEPEDAASQYYEDKGLVYVAARQTLKPNSYEGSGWILVISQPASKVFASVQKLQEQSVQISLVVMVLSLVACIIFSESISKPIIRLKESLQRITSGDYSLSIAETKERNDELGELYRHFYSMVRTIGSNKENLENTVAERTEDLKKVNTELLENQKALVEANQNLQNLDKLKDEFISIASHELRNPIMPILGYIDLAVKGYMPAPQALERIKVSAEKLRRLTTDILDSSKIGSNNLVLKLEKTSVNELVRGVAESARVNPNLKQGVSVETALGTDVMMPIDKSRMTQVLTNIVNNAMKFTTKGSITLRVLDPVDGKMAIEVSDTGDGIPEALLPRLFNKFVTKSNKEGEHGSGLGLYISKGIVEAHGGGISAKNNQGGGCTFTIVLPIREEQIVARTS